MGIDNFKIKLKNIMLKKRLNARDLAAKSGLSYVVIYRYMRENYYGGLSAESLERIAGVLEVTMDELWRDK